MLYNIFVALNDKRYGQVLNRFGKIDILVNNAGIGTLPDFEEEDDSEYNEYLFSIR